MTCLEADQPQVATRNRTTPPLLEVRGLSKSYGAQLALDDIDIKVFSHEIVGLVGENGAGKSTLLKILAGVVHGYTGTIIYNGSTVGLRQPHEATQLGLSSVFQEQALVPNLPVYENMFLSHESMFSRFGIVSHTARIAAAERHLNALELDIDVRRPAGEYDIATRQAIEIARACSLAEVLDAKNRLVLLDEPTASLSHHEIEPFFALVRRLQEKSAFIFVSHRLSEALDLCDRVYVLRDGKITAESGAKELDVPTLHSLMVGRTRDADYYQEDLASLPSDEALRVSNLSLDGEFDDVSFTVRRGEIFSIVGVLGSGKSHVGEAMMGLRRPSTGRVVANGSDVTSLGLRGHLACGLGYVPGDRAASGIVGPMEGRANISLSSIFDRLSRFGLLKLKAERTMASDCYEEFGIYPPELEREARHFSGGNQQKLLLARATCRRPSILILDNPTAGVDAGVKFEIYTLFRRLAAEGCAIVLITDDLLEAIGLGDRISVMRDGRIQQTMDAPVEAKPDERTVVAYMV